MREISTVKKFRLIITVIIFLVLGIITILISLKLKRTEKEPVAPSAPKKSEAAPSGTILENNKLKVTVIDTGPGNYESNTYFKPGGQTDAKPVTNNTLVQRYAVKNKTSNPLNVRLLVFPYKMYTVGATVNRCTDLYSQEEINEFVKTAGNGDLEEAYKKFAEIFYEGIGSTWEEGDQLNLPEDETGNIQAGSIFLIQGVPWQSIWIENKNYKRTGGRITNDGSIDWSNKNWTKTNTTNYPGSGTVIAEAIFSTPENEVYEEIWRKNGNEYKGYRRIIIPSSSNPAYIPWEANNFEWKEVNINQYPGTGDFQTLTQYITGSSESGLFVTQSFWRGNKGYYRQIPIENGTPRWDSQVNWKGPVEISSLPGNGDMQAQVSSYIVNDRFYTSFWRGNKEYKRKAIVHSGQVFWNANHCYDNPAAPPHDPSGGQTRINTSGGAGSLSCEYYQKNNIKTCTDSQTLVSYGNNPPYFTSPESTTLQPGEEREVVLSITNNICGFYQWDHGILINNSEVFWTGSEIKFFPCQINSDFCSPLSFELIQTTPTPTTTPSPTPSPTTPPPSSCNNNCVTDTDCVVGLHCYGNVCRNPNCSLESDCICPTTTQTPQPTLKQTILPTPISTIQTTAEESLPNAGTSTPTLLGIGISIFLLIISIALAI